MARLLLCATLDCHLRTSTAVINSFGRLRLGEGEECGSWSAVGGNLAADSPGTAPAAMACHSAAFRVARRSRVRTTQAQRGSSGMMTIRYDGQAAARSLVHALPALGSITWHEACAAGSHTHIAGGDNLGSWLLDADCMARSCEQAYRMSSEYRVTGGWVAVFTAFVVGPSSSHLRPLALVPLSVSLPASGFTSAPNRSDALQDQSLRQPGQFMQQSSRIVRVCRVQRRGGKRTALEVAPEVEDLPHAQREERAERKEEKVADAVVGRLCRRENRESVCERQWARSVSSGELVGHGRSQVGPSGGLGKETKGTSGSGANGASPGAGKAVLGPLGGCFPIRRTKRVEVRTSCPCPVGPKPRPSHGQP